ncbi:MAG: DJ-1/PfpI family protein [Deltaproteobacteria bacterium]|nr:DJ-1/PfpI family protein [Deltaproteobacteria bacterium]
MKKVFIPIAEGFEEIEAVSIIDVLRRAGIEVVTAGLKSCQVKGANGITLSTDTTLDKIQSSGFDMIILPGGGVGTANLKKDRRVLELLREFSGANLPVAAICAAPTVLAKAGLIDGKKVTCYPGYESELGAGIFSKDRVIVDDGIITSRGPGTAIEFAIKLAEILVGAETAEQLTEGLIVKI